MTRRHIIVGSIGTTAVVAALAAAWCLDTRAVRTPPAAPGQTADSRLKEYRPPEHGTVTAETVPGDAGPALADAPAAGPNAWAGALRRAILAGDGERLQACRRNGLEQGNGAVADLAGLARDESPAVQLEALRLLVQANTPESIAAALGHVLSLPEGAPLLPDALAIFGECRSDAAVEWLVAFLGTTEHEAVRSRVQAILAAMNDASKPAILAVALEKPADPLHREDAAAALLACDQPSHVAMLEDIVDHAAIPEIRLVAAAALAEVGSPRATRFLVARAVTGPDVPDVRRLIPEIRAVSAQEALLDAAFDRALPVDVREAVVSALGAQRSPRVARALVNLVRDPSTESIRPVIVASAQQAAGPDVRPSGMSNEEMWF